MIKISQETQDKIDRATILHQRILDGNSHLEEEFQELHTELSEEFESFLNMLLRAGIIDICIDFDDLEQFLPSHKWIACCGEKAFNNNGKLCIVGGEQIPSHTGKSRKTNEIESI